MSRNFILLITQYRLLSELLPLTKMLPHLYGNENTQMCLALSLKCDFHHLSHEEYERLCRHVFYYSANRFVIRRK